jgi:magnesium chelatase family protein
MVAALARRGAGRVIVPAAAVAEAKLVPGIEVVGAATLAEAADLLRGRRVGGHRPGDRAELVPEEATAAPAPAAEHDVPDLADVRGLLEARRALEIALAGGHGLVFVGPPGSGKTMLASTIPGLLPPLDDAEAREVTIVASVTGPGPVRGLVRERPFRAPHHTASYAALVGGGPRLAPGEVTLAHAGVLFLDELPEFDRTSLEALRQPLEEGWVAVARVGRAVTFPARFQLVAALNPCPCGWAGDPAGRCSCPGGVPERYLNRISGPLRDRIDLWVGVPRLAPGELLRMARPESSAAVAARIAAGRQRQLAARGRLNARLAGRSLRTAAALDTRGERRAVALAERAGLTARATERLVKVARTIADLAESEGVLSEHLEEAARYRPPTPGIPSAADGVA